MICNIHPISYIHYYNIGCLVIDGAFVGFCFYNKFFSVIRFITIAFICECVHELIDFIVSLIFNIIFFKFCFEEFFRRSIVFGEVIKFRP